MRRLQPAPNGLGAAAIADERPIVDLNMTPLIDVLLVLIVMFILLVPAMTHEVAIDLPPPGPTVSAPAASHRLAMARDGTLALDGVGVSDAGLASA